MWAARALKFGYVGNTSEIKFGKILGSAITRCWFNFGNYTMLATISQVLDGSTLKLTYRRNFSSDLMRQWHELEQIVSIVVLSNDCGSFIWSYRANGVYSYSTIYKIVSSRGVIQIYTHVIWSLIIPPKVQFFL